MRTPTMVAEREWIIRPPHPQRDRLAGEAGIPRLLAQVLLNRGIARAADVSGFLRPDFRDMLPPESLPGAAQAADLLLDARRRGMKIVVYGDYDVDGITGTAILWHVLRLAGASVDYYIPGRLDEGYGLNGDALERLAAEGAGMVVSVDCGITAAEPAERARAAGLRLVITDHHEPRGPLPPAEALVHPTACGESGGNRDLSGAGVALKVAWAFAQRVCGRARVEPQFRDFLLDATALAALGTIADVVPLVGENRLIARYGLSHLRHTRNAGVRALLEVSGLASKRQYDDYDVGFMLAPRLNAVGRMGHARQAVELFTSADEDRARAIAATLDAENRRRRSVERDIFQQAEAQARARGFDRAGCHGIVLASEQWHAGVIGIVAARLVERFGRPTVLIALENGRGQGSGRSVRHFPLHEVLAECAEHLVSFGGHAMAAGLKIDAARVEPFTRAFLAQAAARLTPADLRPRLVLDDEVSLADLTLELAEGLTRLAPFGPGNERPRVAVEPVELAAEPRRVGSDGAHLQLTVRRDGECRRAVAFHRGEQCRALADHRLLRLAVEPAINEWNGRRSVELRLIDWKPAEGTGAGGAPRA